jgi:amino-acid N-acetyltransferase
MSEKYSLRPATQADFPAIRDLIHRVQINPMGLDWPRFVVAVDAQGRIVGCGQVKLHGDGSRELASIAVEAEWRGQGIAGTIIRHLVAQHPGTLYLTCRSGLGSFYEPFGFCTIDRAEMPPYFQRISRIVSAIRKLHITDERLLVMKRQP